MRTTNLIKLLQSLEYGDSGRSREISFQIGNDYIREPDIKFSSSRDGICGAELCLEIERKDKEMENTNLIKNTTKIGLSIINFIEDSIQNLSYVEQIAVLSGIQKYCIDEMLNSDKKNN